jgi:hypothetical protein
MTCIRLLFDGGRAAFHFSRRQFRQAAANLWLVAAAAASVGMADVALPGKLDKPRLPCAFRADFPGRFGLPQRLTGTVSTCIATAATPALN